MTTADLFGVQLPLLAAPMAGRPSSPAVVTAVASVGGLGFLAAGYKNPLISPSRTHRDALVAPRFSRTVLTRVFTGRPARGLHVACTWPARGLHVACTWPARGLHVACTWPARGLHNGFIERHEAAAPLGYPQIHHLTRPLRTAAAQTATPTG